METKKFISRAENLLVRLSEIEKSPAELGECFMGYDVYPNLNELCRDCIHLVYAYDANLPLLSEIREICKRPTRLIYPYGENSDWQDFFAEFCSLIQYFIRYLKDFG